MDPSQTAEELKEALATELLQVSSEVFEHDVHFESPDQWLLGTTLKLKIVTHHDWKDVVEGIQK